MNEITIVAPPNRPGTLAAITQTLSENEINITQCRVMEDGWQGVILLTAEPHDEAERVLSEAGYFSVSDDLLLLKIKDAPGQLAAVTAKLMKCEINILSMKFLSRHDGEAIVVMSTDDDAGARIQLKQHLLESNG
ncbi:MAG: ACT domain-containing protein [Fuerstiella sp.]